MPTVVHFVHSVAVAASPFPIAVVESGSSGIIAGGCGLRFATDIVARTGRGIVVTLRGNGLKLFVLAIGCGGTALEIGLGLCKQIEPEEKGVLRDHHPCTLASKVGEQ